jgi:low affinity Fe/Cu permease
MGTRSADTSIVYSVFDSWLYLGKPLMGGIRSVSRFGHCSRWIARAVGQPAGFGAACALIILWLLSGPIFGFSDTWQLIINTSTTIVTFLMVFLIQNTQNRDAEAMHIKLDELIRAVDNAQNALLNLEELEEKDLDRIRAEYLNLAEQSRNKLRAAGLNEA